MLKERMEALREFYETKEVSRRFFISRFCTVWSSTRTTPDVPSVPPRRPHARLPSRLPADKARVVANLLPTHQPAPHPRPVWSKAVNKEN